MTAAVQQQLLKASGVSPSAVAPTTPRREPPVKWTRRRAIGAVVRASSGSGIEAARPPSQPVVQPPEGMPSARGSAFLAVRNLQLYRLDLEDDAPSSGITVSHGNNTSQVRESSIAGAYDMLGVELHRMDGSEPECTTPKAKCVEQSRCTTSRPRRPSSAKAKQRSYSVTARSAARHVSALEEDLGAGAWPSSSWMCPSPPPNLPPAPPRVARSSSCKSRPTTVTKVISATVSTSRPYSVASPRTAAEFKQQTHMQSFTATRSRTLNNWQHMITPLSPRSARPSKSDEWDAIRAKPWSFEQGLATGRTSTEWGNILDSSRSWQTERASLF